MHSEIMVKACTLRLKICHWDFGKFFFPLKQGWWERDTYIVPESYSGSSGKVVRANINSNS